MRTVIIGGPQCGKSTYASSLGVPHFCADPKSLVKSPINSVTYLPEGIPWGMDSQYVIEAWMSKPGPWVIEGVGIVRALRKWLARYPAHINPADQIIYFTNPHPSVQRLPGQNAMEKGIQSIWSEIAMYYKPITKYHTWK